MDTQNPNTIHVVEIEAAINYWRGRSPSPDGFTLAPELRALAEIYALMAIRHATEAATKEVTSKAMAAIEAYRADQASEQ